MNHCFYLNFYLDINILNSVSEYEMCFYLHEVQASPFFRNNVCGFILPSKNNQVLWTKEISRLFLNPHVSWNNGSIKVSLKIMIQIN